jgi:hypothetical protein
VRLLPPDLSSFIRAKSSFAEVSSSKVAASPFASAETPTKPLGLAKSVDIINQSSQTQIMAFVQSLGLPQDALSSSLISFFKFFSLPLDSSVLKQMRRDVLDSKPGNGKSADSTALAASAAFDKGIHLSDEALKEYAAAIDPAERSSSERSSHEHQGEQENPQKRNTEEPKTPLSEDLKNLIDEIDADGSLLSHLNKIPGKNGQKWIVLPFNFVSGAIEYSVSVRILLDTKNDLHHIVERLTVEVQTNERRWVFVTSKEKDGSYIGKAAISPMLQKREQSIFLKELEVLLGDFVSEISFIDENAVSSFVDCRNDIIISVNEEV